MLINLSIQMFMYLSIQMLMYLLIQMMMYLSMSVSMSMSRSLSMWYLGQIHGYFGTNTGVYWKNTVVFETKIGLYRTDIMVF